ncbi:acyl-CoA desaturase [Jannaschia pohangensis]|uniref:Delta-9 acyl-phospholipid desaturase n=1 Tax=Jannaschia pohangensis TaxID=390807 RepID=A0A1I3IXT9_9RHOB|nr:acyl-CoA desaturase [Jannaschia pohangensis]SFI52690.1 Delta-9 acyl-phospholipid desaturase [Jannaschia pohangensis]
MTLTTTDRVTPRPDSSATDAAIVWSAPKSAWFTAMALGGIVGVVFFASWTNLIVTLVLMFLTLWLGHSVGMHRLLIHRSFETPRWLEYLLVWLGTLVGMAGPIGMFHIHEIRDWQQQQPDCHSFAKHDRGFWRDALWQMHYEQVLTHPPDLTIEARVTGDPFYRWLEATWRWQQLPLALLLLASGGIGLVLWGVCLRVAVSLAGHWITVHFAHTVGQRPFAQPGLAVDGRNLPAPFGLLTCGESWHNNHHAFPRSARMGHDASQIDPGWWLIRGLAALNLAWDIRVPGGNDTVHLALPAAADPAQTRYES